MKKNAGKPASVRTQPIGASNARRKQVASSGSRKMFREGAGHYDASMLGSAQRSFATIDLFCGAGGITAGFNRAGFSCLYANDTDHWALETFRANHPRTQTDNRPIEQVDASAVRRELGVMPGQLDVLVGGPPCQGFSINAPERFLEDPRNSLFRHYMRFLEEFEPKTLLIENVPGMLSLGGGVIFERILDELQKRGYAVHARILFAAHYGVPQQRWRMIILGARGAAPPPHPYPTHHATARTNFKGGKSMTFHVMPLEQDCLCPAVTVGDAIGDLPRLRMGEGGEIIAYDRPAHSEYALAMRAGGSAAMRLPAR